MNQSSHKPANSDDQHLPAELRDLASLLDSSGTASRAEPTSDFERRMFESSRAMLVPQDVSHAAAQLETLAAADRRAAGAGLEAQAFELSREAVASGRNAPMLHLAGSDRQPDRIVVRRWSIGVLRVAAAIAVIGAGVIAYQMSGRSGGGGAAPVAPSSVQLAERVGTEMDALLLAIDMNPHDATTADASDPDADGDSVWMDELFNKESL